MPDFYLRVDAVNMAWSIYDTQDLSTLRGGGLVALNTPHWITKEARFGLLHTIAQGASSALFRFEAPSLAAARTLCNDLAGHLFAGQVAPAVAQAAMRHMTYVADVHPAAAEGAGFDKAEQALLAMNRYRQMQHLSLRWPAALTEAPGDDQQVCAYDGFRPAGQHPVKGRPASPSVWERREYGKAQKHMLYSPLAGMDAAHHFEELCHDPARGNAHRKMAVFYVDGNKFSRFFSGRGEAGLCQFDSTMRQRRKQLLHHLLSQLCPDYLSAAPPAWPTDWQTLAAPPGTPPDDDWRAGRLRLETLLWGGDEIIWVVPAWKGLALAQWFFEQTAAWVYPESGPQSDAMTHCAGLVFCHHNAPIARLTAFARSLAQVAKDSLGDARAQHNALCVAVLESFDAPAESADAYLQRIAPGIPPAQWVLSSAALEQLTQAMPVLAAEDGLPRRVLHQAAQLAYQGQTKEANDEMAEALKTPARSTQQAERSLAAFAASLTQGLPESVGGISPAIALAEWWDYAQALSLVDASPSQEGTAA